MHLVHPTFVVPASTGDSKTKTRRYAETVGLIVFGSMRSVARTAFAVLALGLSISGCGRSVPLDVTTATHVPVNLDKSNAARLLTYYLGGYVSPDGGDPVESGLLILDGGPAINPQLLDSAFRDALNDADGNGEIGWDEFEDFIETTYAEARQLFPTLNEVRSVYPSTWGTTDPAWFSVDMDGVMTEARRRVFVPEGALRDALLGYREHDNQIIYDPGTLIIGEHLDGNRVLETTVKRRRPDGFWDFAVYDVAGRLTTHTSTGPRELRAPIQCTGCHLGQRTFDPEKSFPAEAPDGPDGRRALYVNENLRNAELVSLLNEHAKRSDGVLGLYATLFTANLIADREAGAISEENLALLESLGL